MKANFNPISLRAAMLLASCAALPTVAQAQTVTEQAASAAARMQTGPAPVAPGEAPVRASLNDGPAPQFTRDNGAPIGENRNSKAAGDFGPVLLEDAHLIEKLARFDRERVPERVVHARGTGALDHHAPNRIDLASRRERAAVVLNRELQGGGLPLGGDGQMRDNACKVQG